YMSANMFGYASGASFIAPHVWAINKAQMYAGEPSVQVADFQAPSADFTLLPANARLQAGTPPPGTPEYFVSTSEYLNGQTVYKLHADWDRISTSTLRGRTFPLRPRAGRTPRRRAHRRPPTPRTRSQSARWRRPSTATSEEPSRSGSTTRSTAACSPLRPAAARTPTPRRSAGTRSTSQAAR